LELLEILNCYQYEIGYHYLGVGIGQAARQGPIARPNKSSFRPNSFNKWIKLELFKKPINLIRPDL